MLRGRAAKSDLRQTRSAEDVPEVVTALRRRGVEVAVIGDINVDLRPAFAGLQPLIDTFTLSCEQSMQEPDPGIFRQAPNGLGVTAAAALMVAITPGRTRPRWSMASPPCCCLRCSR